MLLLEGCALNQAVVLLMRMLVLALHLSWHMKLDTSESSNFTVVFRGYEIFTLVWECDMMVQIMFAVTLRE